MGSLTTFGRNSFTNHLFNAAYSAKAGSTFLALLNTNVVDQTPAAGDMVQFLTGDFDVSMA